MGKFRAACGVLVALAACDFTPTGSADDDGDGDGSSVDAAEIDGANDIDAADIDGAVDAPDAFMCVARCSSATTLVTCSGNTEVETTCDLGCSIAGTPH